MRNAECGMRNQAGESGNRKPLQAPFAFSATRPASPTPSFLISHSAFRISP